MTKNIENEVTKLPFAQIVINSKTKPDSMRNIKFLGDDPERVSQIKKNITGSYDCVDVNIKSIVSKGDNYINSLEAEKMSKTWLINTGIILKLN